MKLMSLPLSNAWPERGFSKKSFVTVNTHNHNNTIISFIYPLLRGLSSPLLLWNLTLVSGLQCITFATLT